jgi:hypothetical protein
MLFTLVICSRYKFSQEPLINEKQAYSFFMSKKGVVLNRITLKHYGLSKLKNIFLLKELFFTSPQLKITLFDAVLLQLTLMHFVDTLLDNKKSQLIKRKANAFTS